MSRRKVKGRDKKALKMTRDGLVERNIATGEDISVSKREADFDIRSDKPERETLSQAGTRQGDNPDARKRAVQRRGEALREPGTPARQADAPQGSQPSHAPERETAAARLSDVPDTPRQSSSSAPVQPRDPPANQSGNKGKLKTQRNPAYQEHQTPAVKHEPGAEDSALRHERETPAFSDNTAKRPAPPEKPNNSGKLRTDKQPAVRHEPPADGAPLAHQPETAAGSVQSAEQPSDTQDIPRPRQHAAPSQNPRAPLLQPGKKGKQRRDAVYQQHKPAAIQHEPETRQGGDIPHDAVMPDKPSQPPRKPEQPSQDAPIQDNSDGQSDISDSDAPDISGQRDTKAETTPNAPTKPGDTPDSAVRHDKPGKLRFAEGEAAPVKPDGKLTRKLAKAEHQAGRAGEKLEKAKNKLPTKRKLRSKHVFNEETGKSKRKLYFEKEVKSQKQHLKGALPLRPVKAVANTAILNAHRKIYQVEHENVGIKAAHRIEMVAEAGVRSALRFRKTAPYRKVAKLEKRATKKAVNLTYRKALAENPKLKSNVLSRMWQKRKIKKDYAKAARETKKAAQRAKKAGSVTAEAGKALAGVIRRHPIAVTVVILVGLFIFILMSLVGVGGGIGSGGFGAILSASYLAEDADIDNAEVAYTEWETDLQMQIAGIESARPGFDEYRYNVGEISHNPYELMAYLTVLYQNFPYDAISADLRALFDEQYSLTITESTETRYADPTDADGDGDYEPYDWTVLTVTLTSRSFTDVAASRLSGDQFAHYALLLQTKGSRQYAGNPFGDMNWLPYVSSYYGYRVHPISGAKDLHRGIDIALPAGTEIQAAQDGTVTFAGWDDGYGNYVVIENENGLVTKYAHCETLLVSNGQSVSMGDAIATVGTTGSSTGNHLHFEVLKDGQYLNPAYFADTGSFSLSPVYGYAGAPMGDGTYAALIAEAERFLGYPYRWGGSSPETSFDCSGYISYILRSSGVKDVGRLGAQGLYNICDPVSPADARPGDLIFFHSTYSAPLPVTHVGLYVGGSPPQMIHAGNPISYTRIDTNYWQNHFYSYGRIRD